MPDAPIIKTEGLGRDFGRTRALDSVDLTLAAGAPIGLVGPNGAGKTTFFSVLCGFLRPTRGSVEVLGASVASRRPHIAARQGLVYVPDDRCLFGTLSARENLDLVRRRSKAKLETAFEYFPALERLMSRPAGVLSGGEQQMLAIGRALLMRPTLLILDEPTEGIQPSIILEIEEAIRRIKTEMRLAVLLVEQYLDFAERLADAYVIMAKGSVVASGATRDLHADQVKQHLAV